MAKTAPYRNQDRPLKNPKHEKFALNVVQGMSMAEAYRRAFDTGTKYGSQSARKIMESHPEIALRIANVQRLTASRVMDAVALQKTDVIDGLKEILERCLQREPVLDRKGEHTGEWRFDSAGANGALDKMAKILGLYKERAPISPAAEKSDEELIEAIAGLINSPIGEALKEVGNELAGNAGDGEAGSGSAAEGAGSPEGAPLPPVPTAG